MLDAGPNYAHSGPMCWAKYACHVIFCARIVFSMVILVSIEPPSTRFWKTSLSWILLVLWVHCCWRDPPFIGDPCSRFVPFPMLSVPDLFCVQFVQYPICSVQGYRHVTLLSGSGSPLAPACLFVHVEIQKTTSFTNS